MKHLTNTVWAQCQIDLYEIFKLFIIFLSLLQVTDTKVCHLGEMDWRDRFFQYFKSL